MNKVNFDGLKNIKAPREWLEKAAAIPENYPRRRAGFPMYRAAAAAGIVLVTVVGILVFLYFGRSEAPVLVKDSKSEATESATVVLGFDGDPAGVLPTVSGEHTAPTDAGTPATDGRAQLATEAVKPTGEKNGSATEPTTRVSPTQTATERKQTPTQEPVKPTEQEQLPTQAPEPSAPPQEPTEYHGEIVAGGLCFTATFPASMIEEGEPIYCIYWESGAALSECYVAEDDGQAEYFVMKNGMVYVSYEPGIPIPADSATYEYMFYQNGKALARGTQTI